MAEQFVSTLKRRFVHRRVPGVGNNTICGALPKYYKGVGLVILTAEEAERMHHCRKCFPMDVDKLEKGTLVWVTFHPASEAFLGKVESLPKGRGKHYYIFFLNSWEDQTPHGGGPYLREQLRRAV